MRNKLGLNALLVLLILVSLVIPAFADSYSVQDAVYDTVYYYKNNNTVLSSWEEVIGLRGAGEDLSAAPWQLPDWEVDELDETSPALDYAKTILGMLAAGQNPADAEDRNLVEELAAKQSGDGDFGGAINQTIWSIIALDTANADYDANKAVTYLLANQRSDGGFSLTGTTGDPDPDITGFALIALAAHRDINGVDAAINSAGGCLLNIQLADGGFKSGTTENAESISAVIRGLVACDEDITADKWKKNDQTMIDALLAFKLADGSFSHTIGGNSNSIATRQTLIALADLVNGNVFYNIREGITPIPEPPQNATVRVRVEGASAGLADKTVTVTGTATAMDALKAAVGEENLQAAGGLITQILGESGQAGVAEHTDTYWLYYVIRSGSVELSAFDMGADSYNVQDEDQIVFYIGASDNTTWASKTYLPVITVSPETPTEGQTATLTISAKKYVYLSGLLDLTSEEATEVGNYTVKAGGNEYTSQSGQVAIPNVSAGTLSVRVENYNQLGYPNVVPAAVTLTVSPGESDPGPDDGTLSIDIKVTGKNRETIYRGSLTLDENDRKDPIYALQKTGLDVEVRYGGQYVYSIEGIAEDSSSTAGWKYKVNGVAPPSTSAGDYELEDGDELEWFWAVDASDNGDSSLITPKLPEIPAEREKAARQAHEKAMEELKNMAESFTAQAAQQEELYNIVELTGKKATVLGAENPMTDQERKQWEIVLRDNHVSVSQKVNSSSCEVTDNVGELCLSVEKGALEQNITIQVQEQNNTGIAAPDTHRILSSIYNFSPDGTRFAKPVILRIKLPIEDSADKNLILAWYNPQNQSWVPVPTVVDAANGEIMGLVSHFTKFAVLEQEKEYTPFTDVSADSYGWAKNEIDYLALKGIVSGTDGVFSPDQPVTRAEFVTVLTKALELNVETEDQINFSDIQEDSRYAGPVNAAVRAGLIKGFADNTFRPDEIVTREQIAAILTRVLKLDITNNGAVFTDQTKISPWAREAVCTAAENQLIKGYSDGTFRPEISTTRAQNAVLIYRMLKLIKKE